MGFFDNWNIITFSNKNATCEYFEGINHVLLDCIGDNMAFLDWYGNYGLMNAIGPTTLGYYVVKYVLYTYTLQENTTCDEKISTSG